MTLKYNRSWFVLIAVSRYTFIYFTNILVFVVLSKINFYFQTKLQCYILSWKIGVMQYHIMG